MPISFININKRYLFIGLTGVIVLIVGIWYFAQSNPQQPSLDIPVPISQKDETNTRQIIEQKKREERLVAESNSLTSLVANAAESGDPVLCDASLEGARASCKDIVYYENAMKSKNIVHCYLIKSAKRQDACKKNVSLLASAK